MSCGEDHRHSLDPELQWPGGGQAVDDGIYPPGGALTYAAGVAIKGEKKKKKKKFIYFFLCYPHPAIHTANQQRDV